jgi:hypothetical protein
MFFPTRTKTANITKKINLFFVNNALKSMFESPEKQYKEGIFIVF